MREIKFRAFYKPHKRMFWFDIMDGNHGIGNGYIGMTPFGESKKTNESYRGNMILVDPTSCELMQYTGRKDKNDREVFEGDIYRIEEETDGLDEVFYVVVVWIHEWSMFASLIVDEYNRYKIGGVKELDEPLFWAYTLEDINSSKHFHCGNIYQNPDLLKC